MLFLNNQRRQEADRMRSGGDQNHALIHSFLNNPAHRLRKLQSLHQSHTPVVCDRIMAGFQLLQLLIQVGSHLIDMAADMILLKDIQNLSGGGADQRVSAVGAAMVSGHKGGRLFLAQERADRKAAA